MIIFNLFILLIIVGFIKLFVWGVLFFRGFFVRGMFLVCGGILRVLFFFVSSIIGRGIFFVWFGFNCGVFFFRSNIIIRGSIFVKNLSLNWKFIFFRDNFFFVLIELSFFMFSRVGLFVRKNEYFDFFEKLNDFFLEIFVNLCIFSKWGFGFFVFIGVFVSCFYDDFSNEWW